MRCQLRHSTCWANVDKRSVTANLTQADDRAFVAELVAEADVVLESFAPGKAPDGLDVEALRAAARPV